MTEAAYRNKIQELSNERSRIEQQKPGFPVARNRLLTDLQVIMQVCRSKEEEEKGEKGGVCV